MRRCAVQGKLKHPDIGSAARAIKPGEWMRPYRCPHCGFWHLTKMKRAA